MIDAVHWDGRSSRGLSPLMAVGFPGGVGAGTVTVALHQNKRPIGRQFLIDFLRGLFYFGAEVR